METATSPTAAPPATATATPATPSGTYPLFGLRTLFYLVTPNETTYQHLDDVPDYPDMAIAYFYLLMVVEVVVLKLQGKEFPRLNDTVNSMSHTIMYLLNGLLSKSVELVIYVWLYNHYHLAVLPWDSRWVWLVTLVGVDFLYYWFHRLSHEINIIWASHQVHHSSEDYNLSTALRQSMTQKYYSMLFYFPLALFIPPAMFFVHQQFNLLYQFWIHTEVIGKLGPLEYVLNTPSHHRVHHGRNPYCIDKNYGGMLIVWDRLFNTFQAEDEKITYGLVHPNQFWDPIKGQIFHYLYIIGLVNNYETVGNKMSAVVKGPGWEPGKPWTGLYSDLPEVVEPVQKYDSCLPTWANVYVGVHFLFTFTTYGLIAPYKEHLTVVTGIASVLFFLVSVSSFGALYDHGKQSTLMEFLRCVGVLGSLYYFQGDIALPRMAFAGLLVFFSLSALLWGALTCLQYRVSTTVTKKVD